MKLLKQIIILIACVAVCGSGILLLTKDTSKNEDTSNNRYEELEVDFSVAETEVSDVETEVNSETEMNEDTIVLGDSVLLKDSKEQTGAIDLTYTGKLSDCVGYVVVGVLFNQNRLAETLAGINTVINDNRAVYLEGISVDKDADVEYAYGTYYDSTNGSFEYFSVDLISGGEADLSLYDLVYEEAGNLLKIDE